MDLPPAQKKNLIVSVLNFPIGHNNHLKQIEAEELYHKQYASRPDTVQRKFIMKGAAINEHLKYKKEHTVKSDYRNGQLDPVPPTSSVDHSYSA